MRLAQNLWGNRNAKNADMMDKSSIQLDGSVLPCSEYSPSNIPFSIAIITTFSH